jgi:multiple sugar transport system substrate-binding protein
MAIARKMSRRQFLRASAVGSAALAAGASGLSLVSATPSTQDAVTIGLIDPWGGAPSLSDAQDENVQRFMDSHPNIVVERSDIPFADFRQLLVQGAVAGSVPDVVLIDNPDFHAFAALGVMADLTESVAAWEPAELYFPGHWSSTVFQGSNYGVPVFSNCLAWWMNTAMQEEAGIETPETWDDLR